MEIMPYGAVFRPGPGVSPVLKGFMGGAFRGVSHESRLLGSYGITLPDFRLLAPGGGNFV